MKIKNVSKNSDEQNLNGILESKSILVNAASNKLDASFDSLKKNDDLKAAMPKTAPANFASLILKRSNEEKMFKKSAPNNYKGPIVRYSAREKNIIDWAFKKLNNADLEIRCKSQESSAKKKKKLNLRVWFDEDDEIIDGELNKNNIDLAEYDDPQGDSDFYRKHRRSANVTKTDTAKNKINKQLDAKLIDLSKERFKTIGHLDYQKKEFVRKQLAKSESLPGLRCYALLEVNPSHRFKGSSRSKSLNTLNPEESRNEAMSSVLSNKSRSVLHTRDESQMVKKKLRKRPKTVDPLLLSLKNDHHQQQQQQQTQQQSIDPNENKPIPNENPQTNNDKINANKKSILKNPKERSQISSDEELKLNEALTFTNLVRNVETATSQSTSTIVLTSLTEVSNSLNVNKETHVNANNRSLSKLSHLSTANFTLPKVNNDQLNTNFGDDLIIKNPIVSFKLNNPSIVNNDESLTDANNNSEQLQRLLGSGKKLNSPLKKLQQQQQRNAAFTKIPKLKNSKVDIILMPFSTYSGGNQRPTVQNLGFSINRNLEFDARRYNERFSSRLSTQSSQSIPSLDKQQQVNNPAIDNRFYNLINLVKPSYFGNETKDVRKIIEKNDALKAINIDFETREKMGKIKQRGSKLAHLARQVIASGEYSFT